MGSTVCFMFSTRPRGFLKLPYMYRTTHLHRTYDNEAPGTISSTSAQPVKPNSHCTPVNDVVVHPNQGELISCDQAGRIKQWDLSENVCTHELVRSLSRFCSSILHWESRPLQVTYQCDPSALLQTVPVSSLATTRSV